MTRFMNRRILAHFGTALLLLGCGPEVSEPDANQSGQLVTVAPRSVSAAQFRVPQRDQATAVAKAARLLKAKVGSPLTSVALQGSEPMASESQDSYRLLMSVQDHPELRVVYESPYDSMEITDLAIRQNHGPAPTDVDSKEARAIFEQAYEQLVSEGLINRGRLALANARLSERREGEATSDGPPSEWVSEYEFFVPLVVEGVAVRGDLRDLGLTISVHRTGGIARVEVSELGISGEEAGVVELQGSMQVSVETSDAATDLLRAYPNAMVGQVGLRYLIPTHSPDVTLRPVQIVTVSAVSHGDAGEVIHSKVLQFMYPADDPSAKPEIWRPLIRASSGASIGPKKLQ